MNTCCEKCKKYLGLMSWGESNDGQIFCSNPNCHCHVQKCNKCLAHFTGSHDCDGLMKILVDFKKMNYEQDHSHGHCWEQDTETPACGIPKDKHVTCCLCSKEASTEESWESEWTGKEGWFKRHPYDQIAFIKKAIASAREQVHAHYKEVLDKWIEDKKWDENNLSMEEFYNGQVNGAVQERKAIIKELKEFKKKELDWNGLDDAISIIEKRK